jgi:hypothetical protein
MRFVKWLAWLLLGLVVAVAALFGAARLHDGPLEIIPGGPLEAGERVLAPVDDWSFLADVATIELQLEDETTSRTVWVLVDGTHAYIPASLSFPPFKRWHKRADQDGRAWIRVDGRRYAVQMTRREDAELAARLAAEVTRKYGGRPPGSAGVWFFGIESRR